ncbi:MAG TPA: choice-of-anchor U domain-containing protein, partial [Cellvibrionaceae bacterium]
NSEWVSFTEDSRNSLASAPGEPGYCPSLTRPVWEAGLNEGYHCVRLHIEDGGPNDADGEANSTIVDPGAVSRARADEGGGDGDGNGNGGGNGGDGNGGSDGGPTPAPGNNNSGGGGGSIGTWWLPLLLAGWLRRRRKNAED